MGRNTPVSGNYIVIIVKLVMAIRTTVAVAPLIIMILKIMRVKLIVEILSCLW